jgi:hypothetical protein
MALHTLAALGMHSMEEAPDTRADIGWGLTELLAKKERAHCVRLGTIEELETMGWASYDLLEEAERRGLMLDFATDGVFAMPAKEA